VKVVVCVFLAFIVTGCAAALDHRDVQSCPISIPAPVLQAGEFWTLQDARGRVHDMGIRIGEFPFFVAYS